jgi:aldose 1-epimerase
VYVHHKTYNRMQPFLVRILQNETLATIVLENTVEKTKAEILQYGALLNAFIVPLQNTSINIIDGFANNEEAANELTNGFKSAFLSPFTCRMNKGNYVFNNIPYTTNKFILPPHAIHGLVYEAVYTIHATEATENAASVVLNNTYTGNENGYPFTYTIQHTFTLQHGYNLSIATTITNTSNSVIPYAQGWHPYFTLGETINNCTLHIATNNQVEFDATLLPTGNIIANSTFIQPTMLQETALDDCFDVSKAPTNKVCSLANNTMALHIYNNSNYGYLQVYTPPHRNSIAIENLSGAPDCFNNGLGLRLIEPNSSIIFAATYQTQVF